MFLTDILINVLSITSNYCQPCVSGLRLTTTAARLTLPNEHEDSLSSNYRDSDYPLTLVVPSLPGHDWPRDVRVVVPGRSQTLPQVSSMPDFKPRARGCGGLGYLPRQDAVQRGSSGSLASTVASASPSASSERLSESSSTSQLMPPELDGRTFQNLHASVPNVTARGGSPNHEQVILGFRHHSHPSLLYAPPTSSDSGAGATAAAVTAACYNNHNDHNYSPPQLRSDYFPTLPPPSESGSPVQPAFPLQTFTISGGEESDEGSEQELLNANTVFSPREDGPPASYNEDNAPPVTDSDGKGPDAKDPEWLGEECDVEVQDILLGFPPGEQGIPSPYVVPVMERETPASAVEPSQGLGGPSDENDGLTRRPQEGGVDDCNTRPACDQGCWAPQNRVLRNNDLSECHATPDLPSVQSPSPTPHHTNLHVSDERTSFVHESIEDPPSVEADESSGESSFKVDHDTDNFESVTTPPVEEGSSIGEGDMGEDQDRLSWEQNAGQQAHVTKADDTIAVAMPPLAMGMDNTSCVDDDVAGDLEEYV